ncbi:MAG TPA: protein kinase, partial [Gemmataceae bacterium]|nr:protein kinase [Gemmataceae bacterium]
MPLLYSCPQGHQWEAEAGPVASACPACGQEHCSVVDPGVGESASFSRNAVPPSPSPRLPAVPGYEVLGELGRGGMGVVYKARQVSLKREVALKMLLRESDAGAMEAARFRAEAEAAARLHHAHIVQVYDIGDHGGRLYFALEYMEGGGLNRKLAKRPQPPAEAAAMVETLARAVQHAHRRGVVHRDLKPANILLTSDGLAKIVDFGLAKLLDASGQTAEGAILGTASYMAPEQAQGQNRQVGPAADIWALGAILYEMLTGRPPFRGDTMLSTLAQVLTAEPQPPSQLSPGVPARLEAICLRCLRKDPAERYPTAEALADDLRRFLTEAAPALSPPRRLPAWLWGGAAVAVLALALLVVILGQRFLAPPASRDVRPPGPVAAAPTGPNTASADPVRASISSSSVRTTIDNAVNNTYADGTNAAKGTSVAGPLAPGSSVYDTSTVASNGTIAPTGTVTYFFYPNLAATGTPIYQRTFALGSNSDPQGPLAAGSYSFVALYSGDGNYGSSTSGVEQLSVVGPDVGPPKPPPTGPHWEVFTIGKGGEVFDRIAFPTRQVGYAASRQNLYKTIDGGRTWASIRTAPAPHPVYVLQFEDERTGWMSSDRLYHTDDGGEKWSPVPLPGTAEVRSLAFVPKNLALAAGREGDDLVLFRRASAMGPWEKINPSPTMEPRPSETGPAGYWGGPGPDYPYRHFYPGRLSADFDQILLPLFQGSGDHGALLRSQDRGNHWQAIGSGAAADQAFYDVRIVASDMAWVAGANGKVWEVVQHGTKWEERPNLAGAPISCLVYDRRRSSFGLAPVWKGQVFIVGLGGQGWPLVQ